MLRPVVLFPGFDGEEELISQDCAVLASDVLEGSGLFLRRCDTSKQFAEDALVPNVVGIMLSSTDDMWRIPIVVASSRRSLRFVVRSDGVPVILASPVQILFVPDFGEHAAYVRNFLKLPRGFLPQITKGPTSG